MILLRRARLQQLARELAQSAAPSAVKYRGSDDEWDCIGGHEPSTPGTATLAACQAAPPADREAFNDEQVASALELMQTNDLTELKRRGDFRAFGKRLTWVKLADGCIARLATDLLELRDVKSVREDADLLRRRLETRRASGVRTPACTQSAISTVHAVAVTVRELEILSGGGEVPDLDGALGRLTVVMPRWRALLQLAPRARARTDELARMVAAVIDKVKHSRASEGTKAFAQRLHAQWCAVPRPAAERGEKVQWDSDSD